MNRFTNCLLLAVLVHCTSGLASAQTPDRVKPAAKAGPVMDEEMNQEVDDLGRSPGSPSPKRTTPRKPASRDELQRVQLMLLEFKDRMRVAGSKLSRKSMSRKREIGRLQAHLEETQQDVKLLSSRLAQLEDRHRQLAQELPGESEAVKVILDNSQVIVDGAKTELAEATRRQAGLQGELQRRRSEHLVELLRSIIMNPFARPTRDNKAAK